MNKKITTSTYTSWPRIVNLLSDLVVFKHYNFDEFLQKLIKIISEIIPVDSCLIYLHDREQKTLLLVASKKPHEQAVGKVTMKEGEGITGWVAQHKQTAVIEKKAFEDPRFKPFQELPEDKYESFLSVPIIDDTGVVGVINLQNKNPSIFSDEQVAVVESLVKIIASAFVKIVLERKVNNLENKLEERKLVEKAKGILMKTRNFSEEQAFQLLRKEAMNKRKSMREIAEAIILVWQ